MNMVVSVALYFEDLTMRDGGMGGQEILAQPSSDARNKQTDVLATQQSQE